MFRFGGRRTRSAGRRKIGQFETLEGRTVLSLTPFVPGGGELVVSGESLYFLSGQGQSGFGQLWKTDGTLEGTAPLTDQPPYFDPQDLTDVDGTLFFRGMTVPHGVELWRSDGTPEATQFVADTNPDNNGGPGPGNLTNINGTLYFTGGWWSDVELWQSDGTAAGTYEVADINPTGGSGPNNMIGFEGDVVFTANDGVHGFELWRTDGTPDGTRLVKDIHPGEIGSAADNTTDFRMTVAGDKLYFIADDGEHGKELWASDGTTEGTHLVLDITPGPAAHINQLVEYNDSLYFGVYGDGDNKGLWRSDGTSQGTERIRDLSGVWAFAVVGEALYFSADDGQHGQELWKSFGTAESTVMVADALPGPIGSDPASISSAPLPGGGWALFYNASDGQHPTVYRSDGTAAGTVIVRHGVTTNWATPLVHFDGYIYLALDDEVWRTSVVNGGAPLAHAGGPYAIDEGQPLTLDASATTDPDTADILDYSWDINGDGVFGDATGIMPTLTWHELELLGLNTGADWDVRVQVRDGNGGQTISTPAPLTVTVIPPAVTAVHLSASHGDEFAPKFTALGDLPGGSFASFGSAISADGNVIVGYGSTASTTEPFRWTPSTGLVGLGLPEGESLAILSGLSSDGSTAVGYSLGSPYNPQQQATADLLTASDSYRHPIRWTSQAGFVRLDSPDGSYGSETPAAISADGTVAVGSAYWDDGYLGVQWNATGQADLIGGPSLWGGDPGGPAFAVSADGSIVYGEGQSFGDISGVFRWTAQTGAVGLDIAGRPVATSTDGSIVIGNLRNQDHEPAGIFIARPNVECPPVDPSEPTTSGDGSWCSGTTATIVLPNEGRNYVAWDASADGSVIVGSSGDGAFIWDARQGFRLVADVLSGQGHVLDDWTLTAATSVSDDGSVLVGYGTNAEGNSEAWRADLSPVVQPPVGSSEQLRPLPQIGLDQVSISFSKEVVVAADDLLVAGINVPDYGVSQFAYDSATHTAVWRLSQPIGANVVQLTLRSGADGVRDLAGAALDGEWDNPVSVNEPSDTFPSGDGVAGGDFVFRFIAVPGDVDGDGFVGRRDLAMLVQNGFRQMGDAGFDGRFDLDGDGAIGTLDAIHARDRMGPVPPGVTGAAPAAVRVGVGVSDTAARRIAASRPRSSLRPAAEMVDLALASEPAISVQNSLRAARRVRR
jgi:ELWxxDGT repeat protein